MLLQNFEDRTLPKASAKNEIFELLGEFLRKVNLWVVRDDLFPLSGGGSKARKMQHIEKEILSQGCNAVVTTGGLQSNHCRVVALTAARHAWACTLVLHGEESRFLREKGNLKVMQLCGAKILQVSPDQISSRMDKAMEEYASSGLQPYYIKGGGHCLSGTLSFAKTVDELTATFTPDFIFHASGTGSTQAGLLCGVERANLPTQIMGCSVARKQERGIASIHASYDEIREYLKLSSEKRQVNFDDAWVGPGYEQTYPEIDLLIPVVAKYLGILLDPTYTAKAFLGMLHTCMSNQVKADAKVLFWHTGSVLSLMA